MGLNSCGASLFLKLDDLFLKLIVSQTRDFYFGLLISQTSDCYFSNSPSVYTGAKAKNADDLVPASPPETSAQSDAVAALMSLGFKLPDADKAVRVAVTKAGADASVETLIRIALGN